MARLPDEMEGRIKREISVQRLVEARHRAEACRQEPDGVLPFLKERILALGDAEHQQMPLFRMRQRRDGVRSGDAHRGQ